MSDRIELLNHIHGLPLDPPRAVAPVTPQEVARVTEDEQQPGRTTMIAVLDSGVGQHWYVKDRIYPVGIPEDADERWDLCDGVLPRYVGHGTFVAGVVRQYAPHATILARRVIGSEGASNDQVLAQAIRDLINYSPDVLNLSLGPGRHPAEEDAATPTPQTSAAITRLQEECGTIVVIAAGYRSEHWPQVELAIPSERTVIVGAYDQNQQRADFSDDRDVELWAPGVGVLSSFVYWNGPVAQGETDEPEGQAETPPPQQFEGWAEWDGTSFAAPAVSGAVATAIGQRTSERDTRKRRLTGLEDVRAGAKLIGEDLVLTAQPSLISFYGRKIG